jgi:hypothetical protein
VSSHRTLFSLTGKLRFDSNFACLVFSYTGDVTTGTRCVLENKSRNG